MALRVGSQWSFNEICSWTAKFKLHRGVWSGFVMCEGKLRKWFRVCQNVYFTNAALFGHLPTEYFLHRRGRNKIFNLCMEGLT